MPSLLALAAISPAAAAPSSALTAEPRLQKEVDLSVKEEPLVDVLASLSRQTGAPLAASTEVADERVTIFARRRPAGELLSVIAEHLDYTWTRQERSGVSRLVLAQDLAAKRREQALRAAQDRTAALRQLLEEEAQLDSRPDVLALARQPLDQRRPRLKELRQHRDGKTVAKQEGNGVTSFDQVRTGPPLSPQERDALSEQIRILEHASPECYGDFYPQDAAGRLYGVLPDAARQALWRGEMLRFSYPPEQGRFPLAQQTAVAVTAGGLGHLADRGPAEGTLVPHYVPFHSVERVRASLLLVGSGAGTRLQARVRAVGSFGEGRGHERVEWTFKEEVRDPKEYQLFPGPYLDPAARALNDPFTLPQPPAPKPREVETSFTDVLERLSARVRQPTVADGYTRGSLLGTFPAEHKTLAAVLERICRIYSSTCRYRRGYLLLRHWNWAVARADEPPARQVRRWQSAVEHGGALSFPALLEIGGGLTRSQAEHLQMRFEGKMPEPLSRLLQSDLEQSGPVLRLLHSLPAAARASLDAGRPLALRELPAALIRPLRQVVDNLVDGITGYESDGDGIFPVFKPGQGFELEDRLEAGLAQGVLTLRRVPARWGYTKDDLVLPKELLQGAGGAERPEPPDVKTARMIDGELIEVYFQLPGTDPVRHFFLVASATANEEPPRAE